LGPPVSLPENAVARRYAQRGIASVGSLGRMAAVANLSTYKGPMTAPDLAKMLLERLRRVADAMPVKLLAEFRRLIADDLKAKGKVW